MAPHALLATKSTSDTTQTIPGLPVPSPGWTYMPWQRPYTPRRNQGVATARCAPSGPAMGLPELPSPGSTWSTPGLLSHGAPTTPLGHYHPPRGAPVRPWPRHGPPWHLPWPRTTPDPGSTSPPVREAFRHTLLACPSIHPTTVANHLTPTSARPTWHIATALLGNPQGISCS